MTPGRAVVPKGARRRPSGADGCRRAGKALAAGVPPSEKAPALGWPSGTPEGTAASVHAAPCLRPDGEA
jgi:hypothetical protein